MYMAVGQNQWYHVGVGAPPILVDVSGDWDVHWGYRVLTHGHTNIFLGPTRIINLMRFWKSEEPAPPGRSYWRAPRCARGVGFLRAGL